MAQFGLPGASRSIMKPGSAQCIFFVQLRLPRWPLGGAAGPAQACGSHWELLCERFVSLPSFIICSIIYLYQTHRYLFYTLSYNQMLINFVLLDFSCLWPSGALSVGPLSHGHAPSLWEFIRHSFTPRTFPALQARSVLYTYFQS